MIKAINNISAGDLCVFFNNTHVKKLDEKMASKAFNVLLFSRITLKKGEQTEANNFCF